MTFEPSKNHTYDRVVEYYHTHLCATRKEAALDLELGIETIQRYTRLIRKDWTGKLAHKSVPPKQRPNPLSMEQRITNLERKIESA